MLLDHSHALTLNGPWAECQQKRHYDSMITVLKMQYFTALTNELPL